MHITNICKIIMFMSTHRSLMDMQYGFFVHIWVSELIVVAIVDLSKESNYINTGSNIEIYLLRSDLYLLHVRKILNL